MKKNPYQIMTNILKKEFYPSDEEIISVNSWLLTRWLSNHPGTIFIANYINSNYNMDIKQQYQLAFNTVHGIKYIANRSKETDNNYKIELLSEHYNIRLELAKEYLKLMGEEEYKKIEDYYKVGRIR